MGRIMSSAEVKTERSRLQAVREERLQKRFDDGDPTLRKTIFGSIKTRRTGGIPIESAEGLRSAYASTPLPKAMGEIAVSNSEIIPPNQSAVEGAGPTDIASQVNQESFLKTEQD